MADLPLSRIDRLPADRAVQLDQAICLLIKRGAEFGELEQREILDAAGARRMINVPPLIWFERLDRALQVGAFDRMPVKEIVDRILLPPGAA